MKRVREKTGYFLGVVFVMFFIHVSGCSEFLDFCLLGALVGEK